MSTNKGKQTGLQKQLGSYDAKVNLLRQIDDAASQLGGQPKSRQHGLRGTNAKHTAANVLGNGGSLSKHGLANLNG